MAHHHEHEEGHHHHVHSHEISSLNSAFILGIILNSAFVIFEFAAGFLYNSLGLLSDAGHNLSDVASLTLALLAFRLTKAHTNKQYTYGYKKSSILVSLLNAVILLTAVGMIIMESIEKLLSPQPVEGNVIAWVAAIGVVINAATAWLFMKDKEKDLNVKGAYLHMAADALVSVGVLISGIVIVHTGWYIIDPLIGLAVAGVIIYSTWGLLHDSLRLSLDGVPANIDPDCVSKEIQSIEGVSSMHHLHIWAISTTENAMTTHIVISDIAKMEAIKHEIRHRLEHLNIHHVTLEFEKEGCHCEEEECR